MLDYNIFYLFDYEEVLLNEIENNFLTKNNIKNCKKLLVLHWYYYSTSQMKEIILTPKEKTELCIFINCYNNACKNIIQ